MISLAEAKSLALSFPETDEHPHFDRVAVRARKKIFVTFYEEENSANLKLSPLDQSVFCAFDKSVIYPVPGGWGKKGWTTVNLRKIRKSMFRDALNTAYHTVVSRKGK